MAKVIFYDSARIKSPVFEEIREAIKYRNLILQLVRRDVLTRYKRSVLGIAWTLLNPLGMALVLTLAFSQINQVTQSRSETGRGNHQIINTLEIYPGL